MSRVLFLTENSRILTYKLDEQVEKLSMAENQMLDPYIAGVNDGALFRGRTAEHFLLGAQFEPLTKRDVIAIARLQSWQLAADFFAEITRLKIARSDWPMMAKMEMLGPMDDKNAAIITDYVKDSLQRKWVLPAYLATKKTIRVDSKTLSKDTIVQTGGGASNAWVVAKSLSADGHAMLMNDPHLQHTWPSNFYLATLNAGDFFVTGASVAGLPAIIIGSTKKLGFGVTAALLNTQDSVLLNMDTQEKNTYMVDGKKIPFINWPQRFCVNKKGSCIDEMHHISIFGPVMEHRADPWIDRPDIFAVQWTGFNIEEHSGMSSGFVELAHAKNVTEAVATVKTMTLPGVDLVLADTEGSIAYAYAGLVPKRDPCAKCILATGWKYVFIFVVGFS